MSRTEQDLVGTMAVDADAYYGIHSLRAAENFSITGRRLPGEMIVSMASIKKACARANTLAGVLPEKIGSAIESACDEVIAGKLHDQFIVDPIQGGAGTSTNMNANEVIANRAIELLGGVKGDYTLVHPNDHVNCGQSTNDVYPTCVKMTLYQVCGALLKEMEALIAVLDERSADFDGVVKMGRTQLQDAVPIRLGQEFAAYASVMRREKDRLERGQKEMLQLNLGGTAVGTGINATLAYVRQVVPLLSEMTGIPFTQSRDLIDTTQNTDCYLALSSALKGCAASLSKICNDLRLMSSGPRDGLGEIVLPARQNGSSIMPGKVNPVIPEVVNQIAFRIIGYDTTVTLAVEAGQLELNAFEPVIFDSLYQGLVMLQHGIHTLNVHCLQGVRANEEVCRQEVERSVGVVTALCPKIGYNAACSLAREALRTNRPVGKIALERGLLTEQELQTLLDPAAMTSRCSLQDTEVDAVKGKM